MFAYLLLLSIIFVIVGSYYSFVLCVLGTVGLVLCMVLIVVDSCLKGRRRKD